MTAIEYTTTQALELREKMETARSYANSYFEEVRANLASHEPTAYDMQLAQLANAQASLANGYAQELAIALANATENTYHSPRR